MATANKTKATRHKQATPQDQWKLRARNLVRGEIKKRGLSYDDLVVRLGALGIEEDRQNLSNKIQRGRFSAVFLFQVAHALGMKSIDLWWEE